MQIYLAKLQYEYLVICKDCWDFIEFDWLPFELRLLHKDLRSPSQLHTREASNWIML